VAGSGSTFTYNFPSTVKFNDGDSVGVASTAVYSSTFSITAARGSSTISLIWNAATPTTTTFTIPDGYYSTSDLNYFLQQQCTTNKLYCTNSSGQYVYFVELQVNVPRYAIQFNSYATPTAASATTLGYTIPSGATWSFPASAQTPQITFNQAFGNLVGLTAGTLPSTIQSTNYSIVSTTTPIISPIDSYILTCSLCDSPYSIPSDTFFTLPLSGGLGSLVSASPSQIVLNSIKPNFYKSFTIRFFDQLFNALPLQDRSVTITLAIQEASQKIK